jgi:hypothetical protein
MRRPSRWIWACLVIAVAVLVTHASWAEDVGTIAELQGTAEIGQAGIWKVATIGAGVAQGDTLRTGRPGRLRVVFRDDSVLTAADGSEIKVDEQVIDANRGVARSVFALVRGKVRALVSDYYSQPGAAYQIQTASAVVGVRGTEFVISIDPNDEATDVVGIEGRVEVHSVRDLIGHTVFVTAREMSSVSRGRYPTPARRLDDELFRKYLDKLAFIGAGKPESLVTVSPQVSGATVPEVDRVSAVPAPSGALAQAATSAAPTLPGASAGQGPNVGQLLQQSPAVIPKLIEHGKVGIHF